MITKEAQGYIQENSGKITNKSIAGAIGCNEKTVRNWKKKMFNYRVISHSDFARVKKETQPIANLNDCEWAYLAGLIDGEGSIYIYKGTRKKRWINIDPMLNITNTNQEIMNWLSKKLPYGNIAYRNRKQENCKICYSFAKCGFGILPVLNGILPYLVIKKKQAELVKKFIEIRLDQKWQEPYSEELFTIYNEVKKLNQKGVQHENC